MSKEFKVVFLGGESAVGCRSIVERICKGTFDPVGYFTIGPILSFKTIEIRNGIKIELHIYHTPGQERYVQLWHTFFRDSNVVIWVFSIVDHQYTFSNVVRRYEELRSGKYRKLLPEFHVLVGNKLDLKEEEFNEAKTWAEKNNMLYFETSAKTGYNINTMIKSIAERLHEMREVEDTSEVDSKESKKWEKKKNEEEKRRRREEKGRKTEEQKKLKEEINTLKEELEFEKQTKKAIQSSITEAINSVERKNQKIELEMKEKMRKLENDRNQNIESLKSVQQELEDERKQSSMIRDTFVRMESSVSELKKSLDKQKVENEELKKTNESLMQMVNDAESHSVQQHEIIDMHKEENEKSKKTIETLQQKIKEVESQLQRQQEVIEKQKQTEKLFERVSHTVVRDVFKNRSEMGNLRLSLLPGELEIDRMEVLGSGGFGTVFQGKLRIERDVAIKEVRFFNPHRPERQNTAGTPFRRDVLNEYKYQASFLKNEVLRTYGITEPFRDCVIRYIMEKMDCDVLNLVKEKEHGEMMLNHKFLLMKKMAECVYMLHTDSPPIIHRDIKASNFLYRKKGEVVKICDFGLVRGLIAGRTSIRTKFAGTTGWMAPETKNGSFSVYSDIFSLGVTFWEVLFERIPFVKDSVTFELLRNPGSILPDLETPKGLPEEFKDLLKWMWKERPPREGEWKKKDYRPDIHGVINWFNEIMGDSDFLEKLGLRFP